MELRCLVAIEEPVRYFRNTSDTPETSTDSFIMIYLDSAATTPMSTAALEAYRETAQRYYGNSSSMHDIGSDAEGALQGSRELIASLLNVPAHGLRFTGCGSEATFLALASMAEAHKGNGRHIITTRLEHSSVNNTMTRLSQQGFEISYAPVDPDGRVDPDGLEKQLREDTILVSIQHVNSETGVIQPVERVGELLKDHQAVFHSDMVQGFCKMPTDLQALQVDSVTLSAHKIHGPKGVGAAYIHPKTAWRPFLPGTTHENGFRPGTVDVPAIAAFAAAAKEAAGVRQSNYEHVARLKHTLIEKLKSRCGDAVNVEGHPEQCSPYIIGMRIYGMEGQHAMLECNRLGLAVSSGSACKTNDQDPSQTLIAMGRSEQEARSAIRLSFNATITEEQVEQAAGILSDVIEKYMNAIKT